MAASATAVEEIEESKPESAAGSPRRKAAGIGSLIDGFLNLLSSIPFGIVLLILLIIASMIGMLIQQQELETFQAYYTELTPAEKVVYGTLGFFDIYHAWYFNLLLLLLSLNIILASIDHFPAAWSFIRRKKLTASPTFAMAQRFKAEVDAPGVARGELTQRAVRAAKTMRFGVRVTEEDERTTIFAERGVWNRLGAYAVHTGLLTIFLGGFMTSRGFTGMLPVTPDKSADRMIQNVFNLENATNEFAVGQRELLLPFTVEGLDIQQKLIDKSRGIDAGNTLDWLTRVRIHDHETGRKTDALIHMNSPYDYRGYRFFQASFNPLGSARIVKLRATPLSGGATEEITIERNGQAKLSDGTMVKYIEFNPHVVFSQDGRIDFGSTEYENPAARLIYVKPDGTEGNLWAFNSDFSVQVASAPFLKSKFMNDPSYQFVLTDFEKVPLAHTLSVQYDPGAKIVYVGFTILCLTLIFVFFFSHQRLWIVVEDNKVSLGGDSNRNRLGFEDRAKKLAELIRN
ncbi:MAG: cytochrome c biogenesis protein ResB [Acidobacteriota bacterium]|nr:MAG: cytochrome c biogenesis protein ResB [Acidobacteriota bacterium]